MPHEPDETDEIPDLKTADAAPLLNYPETAALLGVKLATLYSMVSRREVPHVRIGRRLVRFRREEIERWIASHAVAVKAAS